MGIIIKDLIIKRGKKTIIDQLNFEAKSGEIIGLIAPNGTGKTTFFNGVAHFIDSSYEELSMQNINYSNRTLFNKSFFFLESSANLYEEMNTVDHLKLIKRLWKSPLSVNEIVSKLQMSNFQNLAVKKMSLGMKQHLLVAMYLISDAPILLFDEPLNGLDPSSIEIVNDIFKNLGESGKVIMISSHDIYNIQEVCNRVIFLKDKIFFEPLIQNNDIKKIYNDLYIKKEHI